MIRSNARVLLEVKGLRAKVAGTGRQSLVTNTMEDGPRGRAMPDASETSSKVPSPRLRYRMFVPPA